MAQSRGSGKGNSIKGRRDSGQSNGDKQKYAISEIGGQGNKIIKNLTEKK